MEPRCPETLTQPLQCILQHDVANTNVSTQMAAPDDNNHAAIPMRSATFRNHRFKRCIELRTRQQPLLAEHRGGTNSRMKTTPAAPAAHRRYRSSTAATTLHGKTQGFVLRLPPQHKPHTTFMQPSQCILRHDVANPHVSMHMATPDDNNHAAIPMQSATTDSRVA